MSKTNEEYRIYDQGDFFIDVSTIVRVIKSLRVSLEIHTELGVMNLSTDSTKERDQLYLNLRDAMRRYYLP